MAAGEKLTLAVTHTYSSEASAPSAASAGSSPAMLLPPLAVGGGAVFPLTDPADAPSLGALQTPTGSWRKPLISAKNLARLRRETLTEGGYANALWRRLPCFATAHLQFCARMQLTRYNHLMPPLSAGSGRTRSRRRR